MTNEMSKDMVEKKATEKEMYEVIKAIVAGSDEYAEIVEFCDKKIAQINRRRERDAEKRAEKKEKVDEIRTLVFGCLWEEAVTADMVMDSIDAALIEEFEITIYKVRNRLSALVRDGVAKKCEKKVDGKTAYILA